MSPPSRSTPNRRVTRLHLPTTLLLAGISFLGAFSRFTSGSYTPGWYAFQLERAPNTAGTVQEWLIPTMDTLLGALLLPRQTRLFSAAIITMFFGIGLGMRMAEGQAWGPDALLMGLAVTVLRTSWEKL
ncbi:hypothetical protein DFH09DRAFT_1045827 [Mycena vulgaris]|nr:hypothetical protein DFH09DRAFT_1045827 [Mycena vulgaris]